MNRLFDTMKGLWAKRRVRVAIALTVLFAMLVANAGSALRSNTDVHRVYADDESAESTLDTADASDDGEEADDPGESGESDDEDYTDPGSDAGDPSDDYTDPAAGEVTDPAQTDVTDPAQTDVTDPAAGGNGDIPQDPGAGEGTDISLPDGGVDAPLPDAGDVTDPTTGDPAADPGVIDVLPGDDAVVELPTDDNVQAEGVAALESDIFEEEPVPEETVAEEEVPEEPEEEETKEEETVASEADWTISRSPASYSSIAGAFSNAGKYTYFTKKFEQHGHTEATVGADSAVFSGELFSLQLDHQQSVYPTIDSAGNVSRRNFTQGNLVWVKHTFLDTNGGKVAGLKVKLGIISTDGEIDMSQDAVTGSDGVAKTAFYVPNGSYNAYVKYSDDVNTYYDTSVIADGNTVKFLSGTLAVNNEYGDNVNYFNNVQYNNPKNPDSYSGLNNPGAIVCGSKAAYDATVALRNKGIHSAKEKILRIYDATKGEGGYSVINFDSELSKLAAFSEQLGYAETSSEVNVVDVNNKNVGTEPNMRWDSGKKEITLGNKKFLVINYEITEDQISEKDGRKYASPNLRGCLPRDVDHFELAYNYEDKNACYVVAHTLINYITRDEDGTPHAYDGILDIQNQTAGIVFAPAAKVLQNENVSGSIVASEIIQGGGKELHSLGFLSNPADTEFEIEVGDIGEMPVARMLNVLKTDGDGKALDGASFEIYSDSACRELLHFTANGGAYRYDEAGDVTTLTTTGGMMCLTNLPADGTYYVKEVEVPVDETGYYTYTYKNQVSSVKVDETTGTSDKPDLTIVNEREKVTGSLTVSKKVYDNGKEVKGGTFYFKVKNLTTGEFAENSGPISDNVYVFAVPGGGEYTIRDLSPGKYQVIEVEDAQGTAISDLFDYNVSYSGSGVNVLKNDNSAFLTIKNEKIAFAGTLILNKVGDDGVPVNGAVFKLYKDGEPYGNNYKTNEKGVIKLENMPLGDYYFEEISAPSVYVVPTGDAAKTETRTLSKKNLEATFDTVVNKKLVGAIRIKKVDDNEKALAGAQFVLTRNDGEAVPVAGESGRYSYSANGTKELNMDTTAEGVLVIDKLPAGKYILSETKTPKGYKNAVDTPFEINASGTADRPSVEYNVVNSKISANIWFEKVDDTENAGPVKGASFELRKVITDKEYEVVATLTSDDKGLVEYKNLPMGSYYVIETEAPEGYELNKNEYHFVIDESKDQKKIAVNDGTIVDKRGRGSVTIKKIDGDTGEAMNGVTFEIFQKTGFFFNLLTRDEKVATITTADGGMATATGLEWGDYVIKEVPVPGYDSYESVFSITAEKPNYRFTEDAGGMGAIVNKRLTGDVSVKKIDADTKEALSGAVFNLYKSNSLGNAPDLSEYGYVGSYVTGSDGIAVAQGVQYGTYYFVEKSAPEGYVPLENVSFKVVAGGKEKDAVVTVKNDKKLGSVSIKKVDKDEKPLAGAEFTLYTDKCPDDATLGQKIASIIFKPESIWYIVKTAESDAEGKAQFDDIAYGEYVILETAAPAGYVVTEESLMKVNVDKENLEYTFTVTNEEEVIEPPKSSSSSSEKKSSSSSSERKSSSSSSESPKVSSSSSSEKKSSSSSSETPKTSSSSSSEKKSSSSSSEKKSSSSSSETPKTSSSSSSEKKSSSSSSEKKSSSSSSETPKTSSSSSEKKSSSSSSEKKSSSSSSETPKTSSSSSSEKKSSSSSSETPKESSSSSSEKKSSSSSSETPKASSSSSSVKESSSSSSSFETPKDTTSSSSEKKSSSKKKGSSTKKKSSGKKDKSSSSASSTPTTGGSGGSTTTKTPTGESTPITIKTSTPVNDSTPKAKKKTNSGVLGVTLAPEKLDGPVAGVLGEIAAPLTADDLSPTFWLILAGMAAGLLGILIAVTRKRR